MEDVDAEINEIKLFLNGRARYVAENYLLQVPFLLLYISNTQSSTSLQLSLTFGNSGNIQTQIISILQN